MMYTQWNRHVPRLAVATSRNLKDWTKHGPAFAKAFDGKFFNLGCKSGSILTEVVKGKQIIKKINGKYFMYWGEEHVFAATSVNHKASTEEMKEMSEIETPNVHTIEELQDFFKMDAGQFAKTLIYFYRTKCSKSDMKGNMCNIYPFFFNLL